jgi:hypothetical protein
MQESPDHPDLWDGGDGERAIAVDCVVCRAEWRKDPTVHVRTANVAVQMEYGRRRGCRTGETVYFCDEHAKRHLKVSGEGR